MFCFHLCLAEKALGLLNRILQNFCSDLTNFKFIEHLPFTPHYILFTTFIFISVSAHLLLLVVETLINSTLSYLWFMTHPTRRSGSRWRSVLTRFLILHDITKNLWMFSVKLRFPLIWMNRSDDASDSVLKVWAEHIDINSEFVFLWQETIITSTSTATWTWRRSHPNWVREAAKLHTLRGPVFRTHQQIWNIHGTENLSMWHPPFTLVL